MENKKRVGFLDEVRGAAILCMVVYHAMYDLKYIFGLDVPLFFEDWFGIIRDVFAGMFIFISGTACQYSRNNMKRGIQCFFIGMIITFITAVAAPDEIVMFGILHFLGISMMLYGLIQEYAIKIPPVVGIIVSAFIFAVTIGVPEHFIGIKGLFSINIPDAAYSTKVLFPLGFFGSGFFSSDYFPLLPWFFLFLSGTYFGVLCKNNMLPKFFYNTHVHWLAFVGRYTIWIYVLHQPIIYGILCLIFGVSIF